MVCSKRRPEVSDTILVFLFAVCVGLWNFEIPVGVVETWVRIIYSNKSSMHGFRTCDVCSVPQWRWP